MDAWSRQLRGGAADGTPLSQLKGRSMGPIALAGRTLGSSSSTSGGGAAPSTPAPPPQSAGELMISTPASNGAKAQQPRAGNGAIQRLASLPPAGRTPPGGGHQGGSASGSNHSHVPRGMARHPSAGAASQQAAGASSHHSASSGARLHSAESSPALMTTPSGAVCDATSGVDSPRGSVMSLDLASMDAELEGESVQVFVRVRPQNADEQRLQSNDVLSLQPVGARSITCMVQGREPRSFTFDQILWQTPQTDIFEVAGMPMVDNCMAGYNSSIFAYGQTGAGKTYTMMGVMAATGEPPSDHRGLAPRVFEYLFERISKEEDEKGRDSVRYSCRCSFLEIYNETITDLLNPALHNLPIREDQRGTFVENLTEVHVQNEDDVLQLMRKGAENRHVGETRMNRESSRSHSVFTCIVEKSCKSTSDGVTSVIVSRLNLIDLAGSERISSGAFGGSQVQGTHFKEAVHINKSLTTLGRVIMELVEAQRAHAHSRHIPYRDSRLTFLLQDSLGGNAKTMIIANVSPSHLCSQETMSTLQFVSRAKRIRNKAHINLDYRGDVAVLQKEILRLNKEISDMRQNNTEAAFQEAARLREQLMASEKRSEELEQRVTVVTNEAARLRRERLRLDERLAFAQADNGRLEELTSKLLARAESMEQSLEHQAQARAQQQEAEAQLARAREEQLEQARRDLAAARVVEQQLRSDVACQRGELARAAGELAATAAQLSAAQQLASERAAELAQLEGRLSAEKHRAELLQGELDGAARRMEQSSEDGRALRERLSRVEQERAELEREVHDAGKRLQERERRAAEREAQLLAAEEALRGQLGAGGEELAVLKAELEGRTAEHQGALTQVAQLQSDLEAERGRCAGAEQLAATLQADVAARGEELAAVQSELREARAESADLSGQLSAQTSALAATRAQVEEAQAQAASTASELAAVRAELADAQSQHSAAALELAAATAQLVAVRGELERAHCSSAAAEACLQSKGGEVEALGADLQRTRRELHEAQEAHQAAEARRMEEAAQAEAREAGLQAELQATRQQWTEERARLAQELEASQARSQSLDAELRTASDTLGEERAALALALEGLRRDLEASDGALSSARQQLRDTEAELAERRVGEQRASDEAGALQRQLGAVQERLAECEAELDASRREGATSSAELVAQLARRDEAVAQLKVAMQEAEVQASVAHKEQQERLSHLQRELINAQEHLVEREFELGSQIKQLSAQLDAASKEAMVQARLLDGKGAELVAARASLAAHQEALTNVKSTLTERELELSELKRRAAEEREATAATQARDKQAIEELSQELLAVRTGRGDMEQQIKTYLMTNTRQNRAFQEIRRLIEWATTPPSSGRSSVGIPGMEGTPGMLHAAAVAAVAEAMSPIHQAQADQQRSLGGQAGAGQAGDALLPSTSGKGPTAPADAASGAGAVDAALLQQHGAAGQLNALRNSARSLATLYRLRSSLSLMGGGGELDGGPASPVATSPHHAAGGTLPPSPLGRATASHEASGGALLKSRGSPSAALLVGSSVPRSPRAALQDVVAAAARYQQQQQAGPQASGSVAVSTSAASSLSLSKLAGLMAAGGGAVTSSTASSNSAGASHAKGRDGSPRAPHHRHHPLRPQPGGHGPDAAADHAVPVEEDDVLLSPRLLLEAGGGQQRDQGLPA